MRILRLLWLTGLILAAARSGHAERLPVTVYTVMHGLGSNVVTCVRRDSRGFMWFCTSDGLTRFDGSSFVTYGVADGLPHPAVNDLLEYSAGIYWLATNGGGVCRFDTTAHSSVSSANAGRDARRVTTYRVGTHGASNRVNVLLRDRRGRIWAGTDRGLFYIDEGRGDRIVRAAHPASGVLREAEVTSLLEDQHGQVWVGTQRGLVGITSSGELIDYGATIPTVNQLVRGLLLDRSGRLWIGSAMGLTLLTPGKGGCARVSDQASREEAGQGCRIQVFSGESVSALYQHSDNQVWMTGMGRLTRFDGRRFRSYTEGDGLVDHFLRALGEDGAGNLWVATDNGLLRIAGHGFVTYDRADGLDRPPVEALFESRSGELCVVLGGGSRIACLMGNRFETIPVNLPKTVGGTWGSTQTAFQDSVGEWWVPSAQGLYRFPAGNVQTLHRAQPMAVYTTEDGLAGNLIFRLFEDSRGDIWISTSGGPRDALNRWERATRRLHRYTERDGLPSREGPTAFAEDRTGNIWLGWYNGGVTRYRDGRFTRFTADAGVPPGTVRVLLVDHAGRLWLATTAGGLSRVDHPDAAAPRFVRPIALDRLGGRTIYSLVEDRFHRLYVGSARGLYRIDPRTGQFRHYTRADGLADVGVYEAFRDRNGTLWFGTRSGVSQFVPEEREPVESHRVFIGRVNVAGESFPLSDLGEETVSLPDLSANRNQVQIEFFGLAFGVGRSLRYQYRLDGVDQGWSPPTDQRVVNYPRIAPGQYRFLVRAATGGTGAAHSASVSFRILPPVWQRWWFVTLCAVAGAALMVGGHRYRLSRVLELERVRTRIATDLHDDIGANLSKIALMSGVTAQQVAPSSPELAGRLSSIAGISQESVDSMSDIVWAIDPHKDRLHDLVLRMRRCASDLFTASGTAFRFEAPVEDADLPLGADLRRELFLIFKEAVNNVVRHAACTAAEIELHVDAGLLTLVIADNGKGFRPDEIDEGNGLVSMRRRSRALRGELRIASSPHEGTRITLRIPLRRKLRT
ncbi:MAG: sensor histidine kinase [Vicinamibacteraceae bacterium]